MQLAGATARNHVVQKLKRKRDAPRQTLIANKNTLKNLLFKNKKPDVIKTSASLFL
jgi:hypothetical protein